MSGDSPDTPVLKSLNSAMRCSLLSNAEGKILIAHDQEISSEIQWIEYDPQDGQLCLIHENGHLQELGLKLDNKMKENLLQSREVTMVLIQNKEVLSRQTVMIVIRDY